MSEANASTPAARLAELDRRRADKAEAISKAKDEQYLKDREAIDLLEERLSVKIHISKPIRQYVPGMPVVVGIRAPSEAEYKKFFSKINRANGHADAKVAAHAELSASCWVYPVDPADRAAMVAANAGLVASVGNYAYKLAEVEVEEEGKE